MRNLLLTWRARVAAMVGVVGLALAQTGCAHPVVAEPTVVVQARLGGPVYGSIYAPVYGPPPVLVAPPPVWMPPPPPVVMAPRMMVPPPAYYPPRHHHWHGHGHGWGRRPW